MKIAFAGDLFVGGDLISNGVVKPVLVPDFDNADLRVANLEQAISDRDYVADKGTLFTDSGGLAGLRSSGVDVVGLANNHVQDKGTDGIVDTVLRARSIGLATTGAGANLDSAREPIALDEGLFLLAYCDFDRKYLSQVVVATSSNPGVNPLRKEQIFEDLDRLPPDGQAVIYLHWGREHVWLPRVQDREFAKELLEDERVALIVGMHPHRAQGILQHNGKRAYMCVGNFLFPNFYIGPPSQLVYPTSRVSWVTRQYHRVADTTYKKWRYVNRVSLVVYLDTVSAKVTHELVVQDDSAPVIRSLTGISRLAFSAWLTILTMLMRLPSRPYSLLERVWGKVLSAIWRVRIIRFRLRQLGLRRFLVAGVKRYVMRGNPHGR